jgi:hypothetical protein
MILAFRAVLSGVTSRLCENRRLNEQANFSQRRKGCKDPPGLWLDLILKDHMANAVEFTCYLIARCGT